MEKFEFLSFSTGIPKLDEKLDGGLDWGAVHSVEAKSGRGKSAWCKKLAFLAALLGLKVLYIDSDSARGLTIKSIVKGFNHYGWTIPEPKSKAFLQPKPFHFHLKKVLKDEHGIHVYSPVDMKSLESILKRLVAEYDNQRKEWIIKEDWDLIIVDSLTLYYKDIMTIELNENAMRRNKQYLPHVIKLVQILDAYVEARYKLAFVTMQMRSDYKKEERDAKEDEEHENIAGDLLNHHLCCKFRMIKKGDNHQLIMFKNRSGPCNFRIPFKVDDGGVKGV